MTKLYYPLSLVLALLLSCSRAEPAAPLTLNWDLSIDRSIQRVHWPASVADDVWLIAGPGTVRLKIRGGIEHDVPFRSAQVFRGDARVGGIRLIGDIGTVDEIYANAIKLADDWQVKDREDIELFHKTNARRITSGGDGL